MSVQVLWFEFPLEMFSVLFLDIVAVVPTLLPNLFVKLSFLNKRFLTLACRNMYIQASAISLTANDIRETLVRNSPVQVELSLYRIVRRMSGVAMKRMKEAMIKIGMKNLDLLNIWRALILLTYVDRT